MAPESPDRDIDVSGRKRGEDELRDFLESAPGAMVVVDREGKIVLANSQTERMFGYSRFGGAGLRSRRWSRDHYS